MKSLLIILLIMIGFTSIGQTCDTFENEIYNCIDKYNNKQGLWKERKVIGRIDNYSGLGSKEGCRHSVEYFYETIGEGYYQDNKKTGTWKYNLGREKQNKIEREITYRDNGVIIEKNYIDSFIMEYNTDSTIINGYVNRNYDTLNIKYSIGKGTFILNNDKIILEFDCASFSNFHKELMKLIFGIYDRKIRLIKLALVEK